MLTPIYIKKPPVYDGWDEATAATKKLPIYDGWDGAAAPDDDWAYASLQASADAEGS